MKVTIRNSAYLLWMFVALSGGMALADDPPQELSKEMVLKLWDGDSEGMKNVIEYFEGEQSRTVQKALMKRFFEKGNASNMENAFAPFRKELNSAIEKMKSLPEETRLKGHHMVYDLSRRVDEYLKGAIPDHIYQDYNQKMTREQLREKERHERLQQSR